MSDVARRLITSRWVLMTRALLFVAPWFLAPVAWLGVAIWGPSPQNSQDCGGYCALASIAQFVVWALVVALTLAITAVILLVASSIGRIRRARRPVLAVGAAASVPAALLAAFSVMAIVQTY